MELVKLSLFMLKVKASFSHILVNVTGAPHSVSSPLQSPSPPFFFRLVHKEMTTTGRIPECSNMDACNWDFHMDS